MPIKSNLIRPYQYVKAYQIKKEKKKELETKIEIYRKMTLNIKTNFDLLRLIKSQYLPEQIPSCFTTIFVFSVTFLAYR